MSRKNLCLLVWILSFAVLLSGCDAFVRKFTRKKKKENLPREEMVLEPQEYKQTMSKEQLYRQYFLYWQSWQDELVEALARSTNHKKQVSCADQAMKNLIYLRNMLGGEKQKQLDVLVAQLKDLQDAVKLDTYGTNAFINRGTADRLKMRIKREFSYDKVKGHIA
ncbi:MAG: hypothetical protein PHT31_02795 [Candidatus Omnitrophica bacterium]|nr:hypothetical protein [Candidatus Omnitrophota bacterium]MDD5653076.1 hypothetical protein [Candidatus Omnitrophota bacterium]